MDYLQYIIQKHVVNNFYFSFKPCYKWITFNIKVNNFLQVIEDKVLNLVINGLPSISLIKK